MKKKDWKANALRHEESASAWYEKYWKMARAQETTAQARDQWMRRAEALERDAAYWKERADALSTSLNNSTDLRNQVSETKAQLKAQGEELDVQKKEYEDLRLTNTFNQGEATRLAEEAEVRKKTLRDTRKALYDLENTIAYGPGPGRFTVFGRPPTLEEHCELRQNYHKAKDLLVVRTAEIERLRALGQDAPRYKEDESLKEQGKKLDLLTAQLKEAHDDNVVLASAVRRLQEKPALALPSRRLWSMDDSRVISLQEELAASEAKSLRRRDELSKVQGYLTEKNKELRRLWELERWVKLLHNMVVNDGIEKAAPWIVFNLRYVLRTEGRKPRDQPALAGVQGSEGVRFNSKPRIRTHYLDGLDPHAFHDIVMGLAALKGGEK